MHHPSPPSFPPQARSKILNRGTEIGVDFAAQINELRSVDWETEIAAVTKPGVRYPAYYQSPFHAYPQGNLCLEAALEVTAAAQSVHATVFDPAGKELDPE